jgi:hypothetical protein
MASPGHHDDADLYCGHFLLKTNSENTPHILNLLCWILVDLLAVMFNIAIS